MSRAPMTSAGAEQLREELKELKTVKRPKVIEAIATAREHGDLKENAEYLWSEPMRVTRLFSVLP